MVFYTTQMQIHAAPDCRPNQVHAVRLDDVVGECWLRMNGKIELFKKLLQQAGNSFQLPIPWPRCM